MKAIILYGADNPVDGAVLDVLLRKARVIHKSLGIIVPLPQNSESIMDAIFHALFLRGGQKPQMNLFDNEAPIVKVHQDWDRASERQKKSRSLFAQHAIKPDEVAKQLQEADKIYGSPEVVERFTRNACQRLGQPLQRVNGYWKLDAMGLPTSLQAKISSIKPQTISFDQPKQEDVTFISRNHPFVTALSEYLFDRALHPNGNRELAARCCVTRSNKIDTVTTLLLMRLRFLIKKRGTNAPRVAEECLLAGYTGVAGKKNWLDVK